MASGWRRWQVAVSACVLTFSSCATGSSSGDGRTLEDALGYSLSVENLGPDQDARLRQIAVDERHTAGIEADCREQHADALHDLMADASRDVMAEHEHEISALHVASSPRSSC